MRWPLGDSSSSYPQISNLSTGSQGLLPLFMRHLSVKSLWCIFLIAGLLVGCHQEEPSPPPPPKVKAPPPFTLSGDPHLLPLSEEVISVGGFNLLRDVLSTIEARSQKILSRPLNLKEMWLNTFVQSELFFHPKWVSEDRPFRFLQAIYKDKVHNVRLIGINDQKGFIDSLGEFVTTSEEGTLKIYTRGRFKEDKTPLYSIFMGEMLISTHERALLDPKFHSLYKALIIARFEGLGGLHIYPERSLQLWGGNLQSYTKRSLQDTELKGSTLSQARQRSMLTSLAGVTQEAITQSDRVTLNLHLSEERLQLKAKWRAKPNSDLAKNISTLGQEQHTLTQRLTTETPWLMSLKLNPQHLAKLITSLNEGVLQAGELSPEGDSVRQYLSVISEAIKHLKGQILWTATRHPVPAPASKKKISKNEKSSTPTPDKTPNIFMSPTAQSRLHWEVIFDHTGREDSQKSISSVSDFYAQPEVKKTLKRRGVWAKVTQKTPWEGMKSTHIKARMPRTAALLKPLRPQLKELYSAHIALGEAIGVIGFGSSWRETLSHYLQPSKPEESEGADSVAPTADPSGRDLALKNGASKSFFFFYFEPAGFLSALKRGRGGSMLLPFQMMMSGLKIKEGISLSLGVHGHDLQGVFSLPLDLIGALGQTALPRTAP